MIYDCLIVGAGPGGLSAALYFGRAGVSTIIIEKSAPGGKVITTSSVENYPGVVSTTTMPLCNLKSYCIPSLYAALPTLLRMYATKASPTPARRHRCPPR